MLAGSLGYLISRYHGAKLLHWVCKNETEQTGMIHFFKPLVLYRSCYAERLQCCLKYFLSGWYNPNALLKYVIFYALGSLSYSAIAVYSGSIVPLTTHHPLCIPT